MIVVFRCNAGPKIGFGHLMRCRTLAETLADRGHGCVMVGPSETYTKKEDKTIFIDWVPTGHWSSSVDDSNFLVGLAKNHKATWLVLDDYRVDEEYQLVLRDAGMKWLQFDGWADKPLWGDIVLNANPAAKNEDYTRVLRRKSTKLLLGPLYALLRKEFSALRPNPSLSSVKKVLVTFGGGDDRGAIEFVLSSLCHVANNDINFVVVSGSANPNNAKIKRWVARHGKQRVRLYIDPTKVAPLFSSCDMAIMAGGTSTYEAAVCGIPMVLISTAANQVSQSVAWTALNSAIYLGPLDKLRSFDLINTFLNIVSDASLRYSMSLAGMAICHPDGAKKVAKVLGEVEWERLVEKSRYHRIETDRLILRPMSEEDADHIVRWRNSECISSMSIESSGKTINVKDHLSWFEKTRSNRVDYVIEEKSHGRPIGSVSFVFTRLSNFGYCGELGKYIGEKDCLGKGYAKEATRSWLIYGLNELGFDCIFSRTRHDNNANISLNCDLGFSIEPWHQELGDEPREWIFMVIRNNQR